MPKTVEISMNRCGTPHTFWKEFLQTNGHYKKECPNCKALKEKGEIKCLKCGQKFVPGCRIAHTCPTCFNLNKRRNCVQTGHIGRH